jgi:hypothetical protein
MTVDVAKEAKIGSLREEINALHFANSLYWRQPAGSAPREARAEYAHRQDRLDAIRREILDVRST